MNTTDAETGTHWRYFLTYRGVRLPLQLVEELAPDAMRNRNTYFRAAYDAGGRMTLCEKLVYGDVELRHVYRWGDDGRLVEAEISVGDDEPQILTL
ncbi:DUF6156 family protein [Pelomonas cellulosilytica]|uniref:DUF6156 family protein n=1 Tax=Pelomonas cellulosilytica TaxID=2906762 RepID=A0ABS8XZW1_9BURK|nr:DUF6156 family protein [Pelomonas sp. P8]MCE4556795.1 DUF6156 family protein [Pelomonas sp. P8]